MNIDEDFLVMTGYDDCIIGVGLRFGQEPIVMYSYEKVIDQLMAEGMSYEEAIEWFEYNMIGAFVGERTPGFLVTDYTYE